MKAITLLVICLISNAAFAERPRMTMAIIVDNDTSQQFVEAEVDRAIGLFANQVPIDIVVKKILVNHISDASNTGVLADQVTAYHYSSGIGDEGVAITLFATRRELVSNGKRLRGYTYLGAAYRSSAVVVRMIYDTYDYLTIAHEIGHALNAPHDDEGACASNPQYGYIMQSTISGSPAFSPCSLKEMRAYIEKTPVLFYDPKTLVPTQQPHSGGGALEVWVFLTLLSLWKAKRNQP